MYQLSIILFALAALLGLHSLIKILHNQPMSKSINFVHGLSATTALLFLIIFAIEKNRSDLTLIVVLFLATAIAGVVLVFRDMRGRSTPKRIILLQGVLAVSAFLTLVFQV